jgi:glyceraldehyde-3-phosphate dehydrogenase/erythrose-4-phosphate dehydrogenase
MFIHDSVHGLFKGQCEARDKKLIVNGQEIACFATYGFHCHLRTNALTFVAQ